MVELFLESFKKPPKEIVLDFDATDDPIHGSQEGRFFHGYYKNYCYLPLVRYLRRPSFVWRGYARQTGMALMVL